MKREVATVNSNKFQRSTSAVTASGAKSDGQKRVFRSAATGRLISENARIAAARARVTADRKRGVETDQWIVDIARRDT